MSGGTSEAYQKEVAQIKDMFTKADRNGDGKISKREMTALFKRLGEWTESELDDLFQKADKNKDGKVDFAEFVEFVFGVGSEVRGLTKGRVKYFRNGAGEISGEDGLDYIVMEADVLTVDGLQEGEEVEFTATQDRGSHVAINVSGPGAKDA